MANLNNIRFQMASELVMQLTLRRILLKINSEKANELMATQIREDVVKVLEKIYSDVWTPKRSEHMDEELQAVQAKAFGLLDGIFAPVDVETQS